mmetsp:Transcript_88952/g.157476  ORF Transcript_88952/g.157476 Transcript_88952/m.157476 type:complete len:258 (-) Transcript_88952:46-819(-)
MLDANSTMDSRVSIQSARSRYSEPTLARVDEEEELEGPCTPDDSQDFQTFKHSMMSSLTSGDAHLSMTLNAQGDNETSAKGGCCGFCKRRNQAPTFAQTLVVMRHSERKDQVDPTYKDSVEGKAWPHDTPLTQRGVKWARKVARELRGLHKQVNFIAIASSPYRRCMATAAQIAIEFGLPIVIDQELGEVWDKAMPSDKLPHRSPSQLEELAKELGIQVLNPPLPEGGYKLFGQPPKSWPESLEDRWRGEGLTNCMG